jgi:hypothetical protein
MATPHVAGVASLLLSAAPSLTPHEARTAILESVDLKPSLAGKTVSQGRLNAHAALEALPGEPDPDPEPPPEEPEPDLLPEADPDGPQPAPTPEPEPPIGPAPPAPTTIADSGVGPRAGFVRRPGWVKRTPRNWAWGRFQFRSSSRGASFLCKVDRSRYRRCGERAAWRFGIGRHVVRVKARDGAGNVSPNAVVHRFRVERAPG